MNKGRSGNKQEHNQYQSNLDMVFSALSDSTRRAIVQQLAKQPATVSDLAVPFDMSLAAVSKHLKVLEQAGIIRRSVDGRVHHISLVPEQLTGALDWISIYRQFWQQRFDQLGDGAQNGENTDE